jgi:prevent-host-death family protein
MTQLSITAARTTFLAMPEQVAKAPEHAISITKKGRPVLAVMSWDFYESLAETLDIFGDPELTTALRTSIAEMEAGQLIDHDEVVARIRR